MKPDHNRRGAPRVSAREATVELLDFRPRVRDLSESGAFVEDPRPLPRGRMLHILLRIDEHAEAITLWGMVRRVEEGKGMAVEFLEMSATDKAVLQKFLQERIRKEGTTEDESF